MPQAGRASSHISSAKVDHQVYDPVHQAYSAASNYPVLSGQFQNFQGLPPSYQQLSHHQLAGIPPQQLAAVQQQAALQGNHSSQQGHQSQHGQSQQHGGQQFQQQYLQDPSQMYRFAQNIAPAISRYGMQGMSQSMASANPAMLFGTGHNMPGQMQQSQGGHLQQPTNQLLGQPHGGQRKNKSSQARPLESEPIATSKKVKPVKEIPKPPTKSLLKPPKKILSAWQIFYSEFLEQCKQQNPKLNIPEVAKEAGLRWANMSADEREAYNDKAAEKKAEYVKLLDDFLATLSREDYERENAFRKAQRTAGKSRKADLKDPNKPKRPMSAYFFYQQHLKQLPDSTNAIFGGETNATKQASIAGSRWRNLSEEDKKEFHELATQDRKRYDDEELRYKSDGRIPPKASP